MCHGVPLLCHVSRSGQLQILDFVHRARSNFRAGWLPGRSLMSVASVVDHSFRSVNGRLVRKTYKSVLVWKPLYLYVRRNQENLLDGSLPSLEERRPKRRPEYVKGFEFQRSDVL